jgi:hypothetical protein
MIDSAGDHLLECWSIGVLGVLEAEVYIPRFRQYGVMIISSVDVWIQKSNLQRPGKSFLSLNTA